MQLATGKTTVSKKWQVVVPKEARKKLQDVKPGQKAWVQALNEKKVLISFQDPIEEGVGLLKSKKSLTKALLKARRKEKLSEEKKLQKRVCS